jgi:type I restriction enzyme S subunit
LGDITEPVTKVSPRDRPDTPFTYLDISAIDNMSHSIAEPKTYYGAEAPSRARQLVKADDVLFSTVRTYLRNIAPVPDAHDGQIASTGFSVLRAGPCVLPGYVLYYSLTDQFVDTLTKLQRGTSYPAVTDGEVRARPFPVAPLPEQQRIVEAIDTQFTRMDAAVAALERAQANLKRYRASVLKAACEGRLVPTEAELARAEGRDYEPADQLLQRILAERRANWEEEHPGKKYKEPAPPDTADLPELPEGWVWCRLEQIAEVVRGASPRPKGDPRYFGGPIPWIKISDITKEPGVYLTRTAEGVTEEGAKKSRHLPAGTLILSNSGTVCVPRILAIDGCVHDGFVAFPDLTQQIDILYLLYHFDCIRPRVIQANRQGMTQVNLNTTIVRDLAIALPSLTEQHRIVAEVERRLSLIDALEREVGASLARAARLRQSILKRAFEGRLVEQDPNDEPASVLLERIKAQRKGA